MKRDAPGYLAWDTEPVVRRYPTALEKRDRLSEQYSRSEPFVLPEAIELKTKQRIAVVLKVALPAPRSAGQPHAPATTQAPMPPVYPFV